MSCFILSRSDLRMKIPSKEGRLRPVHVVVIFLRDALKKLIIIWKSAQCNELWDECCEKEATTLYIAIIQFDGIAKPYSIGKTLEQNRRVQE